MNKLAEEINKKLETKPLIFFCREVERVIGLETVLKNYHIACVEDSAIVDILIERGFSVFCLERYRKVKTKGTNQLLSDSNLKDWVEKISMGKGFYAQTFLPSNTIAFKVEKLGGTLLANDFSMYLDFENKVNAAKFFSENKIKSPENIITQIDSMTYLDCISRLGKNFVIQLERAHTGSGTFIIENEHSFNKLQAEYKGNIVKISKFISGKTYTLNVCITKDNNFVGPIQYQIPGVSELTTSPGTTVGNDFGKAKKDLESKSEVLKTLESEVTKLANAMRSKNYIGLFGIDLMIADSGEVSIIEINARQTANIPFQTQIELRNELIPLSLINLANWLDLDVSKVKYNNLNLLNSGSQLFLRSLENNTIIDFEPKSGSYRLLSDNSAIDWNSQEISDKEDVLFVDSEKDKPLVFLEAEYRLDKINNSFLIQFSREGSLKNKLDEICRMQFLESIIDETDKIKPWILESMVEIRKVISRQL